MRPIFLLLLVGLSFAQYADPPLSAVMANNAALAPALEEAYDNASAFNTTVDLHFDSYHQTAEASASIEILGLSPSIDNMSCAMGGLSVLIARGSRMDHLISLSTEGYPDFVCDRDWYLDIPAYPWRCDFDTDTCVEYENRTGVDYRMNVTFSFKDVTRAVPFDSTLIAVPPEVLSAMDSASGNDSLLINISGDLVFFYEIDDRGAAYFGDCGDNYVTMNSSIPVSVSRSFPVGGSRKLFFLGAPVLREQWVRSNSFAPVILTQCPLYQAEISLNGNTTKNMTLRSFSIITGRYGVQSMVSNDSNISLDGWSEDSSGVASPFQLEKENISFLYAYRFTHRYPGLGDNNLSIHVKDVAQNEVGFNETITSRMLSVGGAFAEDGSPVASVPARPSLAPSSGSLGHIEIVIGLAAMVVIIIFINSWLLDRW
ncbi:MAG: hypothetical protein V1827_02865 [Candidatus Micrarchaeota archaeon]